MISFNGLDKKRALPIIHAALKEDIGKGDVTTFTTIHKLASIRADIVMRESGVVCGLPVAEMILNAMDYSVRIKPTVNEGDQVNEGKEVVLIEGPARPVLMAERTVLNFIGHLSGIATRTREFVKKVRIYRVKIMDTRKTTPLLRYMEKYAVKVGGGYNHRMGLWDQILIKDTHIKVIKCASGLTPCKMPTIKDIVENARRRKQKNIKLEVEVSSLSELEQALQAGPDIVMLDNMSVEDVKKAVEMRDHKPASGSRRIELEASGGITLDNVEKYAACGIDMISVGSLTKDVKALDVALEVVG